MKTNALNPGEQPTSIFQSAIMCQIIAWSISLLACILVVIAWGSNNGWQLFPISIYQLFPVLGLLAFSLMWSHYIASALRQLLGLDKRVLARYFESTSLAVVALICLHPGLLIYQRFRDGHGLPPGSYESYVAPSLRWVTLLGTASLLVFLAYEFRRLFGRRSWWHFVQKATDIAMLAIFYHGLRLGSQLQRADWFTVVWWFFGITLIAVLAYTYSKQYVLSKT